MFELNFLFGFTMLLLGRQLFWIFVGAVGYLTAVDWVNATFSGLPELHALLIAIGAGVLGALLAIVLKKVGIGLAGFLSGGLLANLFLSTIYYPHPRARILVYIFSGIVGLIFFYILFDWALIFISSITGAFLVAPFFRLNQALTFGLMMVLAIIGFSLQVKMMYDET